MFSSRIRRFLRNDHGTHRGFVRAMLAEAEFLAGRLDAYVQPDLRNVERVVFVCLGNICRSSYADWLARREGLNAASFGLETSTGMPAFELSVETAARFGVDLATHRTTAVADFRPQPGDLYLCMEIRQARRLQQLDFARGRVALLGAWATPQRLHLHDPHTLSREYFRTCFALVNSAVVNLKHELIEQGAPAAQGARRAKQEAGGGRTAAS